MITAETELSLWGHSLEDYKLMFDLSAADLTKRILDYGAGPSSFNAEMRQQDKHVVSCDALYTLSLSEISQKVATVLETTYAGLRQRPYDYVWKRFTSPGQYYHLRQLATERFFTDLPFGIEEKRYLNESLPTLSFQDYQFDLVLCAYPAYSTQESADFYIDALCELCRVGGEVRIFPLLTSHPDVAKLLGPVMLGLQQRNYGVEIRQVAYEFQQGVNAMLRVWSQECALPK